MFLWGARGPSFGHNFDFDSSPGEAVMPIIGSGKRSGNLIAERANFLNHPGPNPPPNPFLISLRSQW